MPSIYKYINYREYLHDYFLEQKQFQKQLTHRAVLKKMGITSTGFLSNVIAGKKNLSEEISKKLGKIINLATRERRYLNIMVAYVQAKSIEETAFLLTHQKHGQHLGKIWENWFESFFRDRFSDNFLKALWVSGLAHVEINIDGEHIRKVIQNFLLNAIEAMPNGGTIKISTKTELRNTTLFGNSIDISTI